MLSLSHQKLIDKTEVACCLGSPQCSCSDCKMEAAFGGFTILDFPAKSEPAKRLSPSPKMASMGDGHRCKKFPCPICHPGRSQRGDLSSAAVVTVPQMPELYAPGAVHMQAGVTFFGDGGHTCRRFPCPICHKGRSAILGVEVGC